MSTPEIAALITAIAGVVAGLGAGTAKLVMWCVTKWLEDRAADRQERAADRQERKEDRAQDREATRSVATAMTTMALKFESFEKRLAEVQSTTEGVAQWAVDEVTGKHDVPLAPPTPTPPRRTPPKGYLQVRPKTEGG